MDSPIHLLFGVSKSAAQRIIDHLAPMLALQSRKQFAKDTVLIVDGTLVPTRDHTVTEQSKNYRYSTNQQVVIDADRCLVVMVGRPLPGNRNVCRAWEESGASAVVGTTVTIADGGYPGTGLLPGWRPVAASVNGRSRVASISATTPLSIGAMAIVCPPLLLVDVAVFAIRPAARSRDCLSVVDLVQQRGERVGLLGAETLAVALGQRSRGGGPEGDLLHFVALRLRRGVSCLCAVLM